MKDEFYDWFINVINYLIFIFVFVKSLGSMCFSSLDLTITLMGISASVLLLLIRTMRKSFKKWG
jgi:hypothetical protein